MDSDKRVRGEEEEQNWRSLRARAGLVMQITS